MEQSDWSCHILEFGTTQCYQTPFRVRFRGLGHETMFMYTHPKPKAGILAPVLRV